MNREDIPKDTQAGAGAVNSPHHEQIYEATMRLASVKAHLKDVIAKVTGQDRGVQVEPAPDTPKPAMPMTPCLMEVLTETPDYVLKTISELHTQLHELEDLLFGDQG